MFRFIEKNKAKCLLCGSIVLSPNDAPSQQRSCDCGKLTISGGATHLLRTGVAGKTYEELSVLNVSPDTCPEIREDIQDAPPDQK